MQAASIARLRFVGALALLAALLVPTTAARAARGSLTPEQMAEACIHYMDLAVKSSQTSMSDQAERTIFKMQKLADKGAPDEAIVRVAMRGKRKIDGVAHECSTSINRRADQCLDRLEAAEADLIVIQQVTKARALALDIVQQFAASSRGAIMRALADALGRTGRG